MAAAVALLLLLPGMSVATPLNPLGAISQYLSIRTAIDDLFTGAWQQMQNRMGAEQRLNQDYEAGRQRLDAEFRANKLIVRNLPLLGVDQKAQCLNKLNESYEARLNELGRRIDGERAKLACCQF